MLGASKRRTQLLVTAGTALVIAGLGTPARQTGHSVPRQPGQLRSLGAQPILEGLFADDEAIGQRAAIQQRRTVE